MLRFCRLLWSIPGLIAAGCASHGAVHVAPDESRPHITWEIRTGGADSDEEFVCGSAKPGAACVLPASTAELRRTATAHLYLHAAADSTSYLGVFSLPFLGAGAFKNREVNTTVPSGSRPVGITIQEVVTSTPGSYTLNVQLDATQPNMPAPLRISEQVAVAVK